MPRNVSGMVIHELSSAAPMRSNTCLYVSEPVAGPGGMGDAPPGTGLGRCFCSFHNQCRNEGSYLSVLLGAGLYPHLTVINLDHAAEGILHQRRITVRKNAPKRYKKVCSLDSTLDGGSRMRRVVN